MLTEKSSAATMADILQCTTRILSCQSNCGREEKLADGVYQGIAKLYLALGNIALVFAAQVCRDSGMESLWSYKGDHNLTDCGTEIYDLT